MEALALPRLPKDTSGPALPARVEARIAAFVLAAVAALQFPLIWSRAINWDELFHYSQITRFRDGTLSAPLQTFYIRLFDWIYDLPGSSIDHIVSARFAMFGFELLAAAAIVGIASRLYSRTTAVLCGSAYLGAGFVFQHGFSFRADPVAAGLLMTSLWLILATKLPRWAIALAGLLIGLAAIYTIKVVLYAPAFAGIAWLAWDRAGRSRSFGLRLLAVAPATAASFAALYLWHASHLHGAVGHAAGTAVSSSAENMFFLGVPVYLVFIAKQALIAPVFTILVGTSAALLVRSRRPAAERIAIAGLMAPLATLAFYHNTAPYYYVFMLAPVAVGTGLAIEWVRERFGVIAVAAAVLANAGMLWAGEDPAPMRQQRVLIDTVERAFPQPVAYFDFCGFVGRFPKANGFMTPWGLVGYLRGDGPGFRERMQQVVVPLVVNDDPMFERLFTGGPTPEFRPADAAALRDNYVSLWGPYWIAGKNIASSAPVASEFLVPGTYTVRTGTVVFDGARHPAGSTLEVSRGLHTVAAAGSGPVQMTWGTGVQVPPGPYSGDPFWVPF